MSVTDEELRPPRETAILGLPIPGDVGPADYVSATGALADAIDANVEPRVPVILPAELSQAPYNNPRDGEIVDVVVDQATSTVWRLRWRASITADGHKWCFVGGTPLEAFSSAYASPATNAWVNVPPSIAVPRPGIYRVFQSCQVQVNAPLATVFAAYISVDRPGAAIVYEPSGSTGASGAMGGGNNAAGAPSVTGAALVHFGRTSPIPAGETIRYTQFVNGPVNQVGTGQRGLQLTPIRIS